jgi:hypothetical protein
MGALTPNYFFQASRRVTVRLKPPAGSAMK